MRLEARKAASRVADLLGDLFIAIAVVWVLFAIGASQLGL